MHVQRRSHQSDPMDVACDVQLLRAVRGRLRAGAEGHAVFNFAQAGIMTVAFYTAFVAVQWLAWPARSAFVAAIAGVRWRRPCARGARISRRCASAGVSAMFVFIFTLHRVGVRRLSGDADLRHLAEDRSSRRSSGRSRSSAISRCSAWDLPGDRRNARGDARALRFHALYAPRASS